MRQGGAGEVVMCSGFPLIPCLGRTGVGQWQYRASVAHFVGARVLRGAERGWPSGADPEHQSEKKLAVQEGKRRRSTKGAWAL